MSRGQFFAETGESGPAVVMQTGSETGLIRQRYLEGSNADLDEELVRLQRLNLQIDAIRGTIRPTKSLQGDFDTDSFARPRAAD